MVPFRFRLRYLLPCLLALSAAHAQEPAHCTYEETAVYPIRYAGDSLVPTVDGSINGKPAVMAIDTDAGRTTLTLSGATRRNLSLRAGRAALRGAKDNTRVWTTRVEEFSFGPARTGNNTQLYVIGDAAYTSTLDAVLGAQYLFQSDLELDLPAKRMRLLHFSHCSGVTLRPWTQDTVVVPIDPRREFRHDIYSNPHFNVVLNGKDVDAVIDSGTERSYIVLEAARRVGIDVTGPEVVQLASASGSDPRRMSYWNVPLTTLAIGEEVIQGGRIDVFDSQLPQGGELHLGRDFLRTHRVLFAVAQGNIYVAYLGGTVFDHAPGVPTWMLVEAVNGNADAQFRLARQYGAGNGTKRDPAQAAMWLKKAAALGHPYASLHLGRQEMLAGHVKEAIPLLRTALDQLPTDRYGALWLYNARVTNGERDLARNELAARLDKQQDDWPAPIASFYLGKLDAAGLLAQAASEPKLARQRSCQAGTYIGEWYAAQGDKAQADAFRADARSQCDPAGDAAGSGRQTP